MDVVLQLAEVDNLSTAETPPHTHMPLLHWTERSIHLRLVQSSTLLHRNCASTPGIFMLISKPVSYRQWYNISYHFFKYVAKIKLILERAVHKYNVRKTNQKQWRWWARWMIQFWKKLWPFCLGEYVEWIHFFYTVESIYILNML